MNRLRITLCLALGLVATEGEPAAHSALAEDSSATSFVVGLTPFLDKSMKDDVYRAIVRLLVEDLPLNSTLSIYDAFALKSITQVALPAARAFNSSKTRANQFAPAIRELRQFLAEEHPKPAAARLNFDNAIRLPQFCDFLAENHSHARPPLRVLLVGSPLYQDAKETAFSMVEGYFPSDGNLRASREESVFGKVDGAQTRPALVFHWIYFNDPWLNELHKEKVTRFWTLYLEQRDGQLASLSSDLPTGLRGFLLASASDPSSARRWAINPRETKIEMLRVNRTVEIADWLTRDSLPELAPRPPSVRVGPMKIGIRWKPEIDLDLYAAPRRGGETLFFQHPRSPDGFYYKDHRSSPGREYEFIEFEAPVDVREVEAFVNFYQGDCPQGPRGEVRIEFDGRIYSAPFSIAATSGNLGRTGTAQQDFWARIPIQEILRINSMTSRADSSR